MTKLIMLHSFRGGTGKTNISANVGALLAANGLRVGVIDTDIQSPGLHVLFGLDEKSIDKTMNNYLWGENEIEEAAIDVTDSLPDQQDYQGTNISMKLAQNLEVSNVVMIVNKSPRLFNKDMVKSKVEEAFNNEVAAVAPHSDEMMALSSAKLFVVEYPHDPLTGILKKIAVRLMT
ncbi:MAG: hypothetical protein B6I38_03425 [Anaerolineaceae bacterium 4572_5.1]|nr:MAG: hypothetical protein B6I38_03425 [Anaerolineaceae bacterium 4572_5.1]